MAEENLFYFIFKNVKSKGKQFQRCLVSVDFHSKRCVFNRNHLRAKQFGTEQEALDYLIDVEKKGIKLNWFKVGKSKIAPTQKQQ